MKTADWYTGLRKFVLFGVMGLNVNLLKTLCLFNEIAQLIPLPSKSSANFWTADEVTLLDLRQLPCVFSSQ